MREGSMKQKESNNFSRMGSERNRNIEREREREMLEDEWTAVDSSRQRK